MTRSAFLPRDAMARVAIRIALGSLLVIPVSTGGCERDRATADQGPAPLVSKEPRVAATAGPAQQAVPRGEVQAYIRRMTEQYELVRQGITMELRETEGGLKILMRGEVGDADSLKVWQMFFENPCTNPDLPVPLLWDVSVRRGR
jgi:hypothetical protein